MRHLTRRRGFAVPDLVALLAIIAAIGAIVVPALSGTRGQSQLQMSMSNLATLGFANALYEADWNGRQYTNVVDDLSVYGSTAASALSGYQQSTGDAHPPLLVGWGGIPGGDLTGIWGFFFDFGNAEVVLPIEFSSGFGNFRMPNSQGFHNYVGGRWFDPTFYAPADTVVSEIAEPFFDDPDGYIPEAVVGAFVWSSYCFSPAAMYDELVLRAPSAGGFIDPFELVTGLESPPAAVAGYPDLKTRMIEHHWLQGPPAECNPVFGGTGTYFGCEPYYFNMGIDSSPAALFFDGHVRVLPNTEALAADEAVLAGTGGVDGLWHRGTPLGPDGYFIDDGFDGTPLSHHVLTTDGILGRDTIAMPPVTSSRFRRRGSRLDLSSDTVPGPFRSANDDGFVPAAPGSASAFLDLVEGLQ